MGITVTKSTGRSRGQNGQTTGAAASNRQYVVGNRRGFVAAVMRVIFQSVGLPVGTCLLCQLGKAEANTNEWLFHCGSFQFNFQGFKKAFHLTQRGRLPDAMSGDPLLKNRKVRPKLGGGSGIDV